MVHESEDDAIRTSDDVQSEKPRVITLRHFEDGVASRRHAKKFPNKPESDDVPRAVSAARAMGAPRHVRLVDDVGGAASSTRRSFLGIHPLHHCKLWYFLSFGAYACIYPYLPLFYKSWGISPEQVGFINCLRPLVSFCVTPIWGAAADASGRHNAILVGKMLAQGYGYALLALVPHRFPTIFAYVLLLETFSCANNTLADSATGQMCRRAAAANTRVLGGTSYGDQRLWGAVAWGYVFAPAMGATLTYAPRRVAAAAPFVAVAALLTISAGVSLGLDFTPVDTDASANDARDGASADAFAASKFSRDDSDSDYGVERERLLEMELAERSTRDVDGTSVTTATIRFPSDASEDSARCSGSDSGSGVGIGVGLGSDAGVCSGDEKDPGRETPRADASSPPSTASSLSVASRVFAVVSRPGVALMFLVFLLMGASMAVTDVFLFLWLDEQGGSRLLMGLALCFTCLSEVVVFAKEKAIKRALSTRWSVSLILLCYALRQWFYAALPAMANPWTVLPIQLLHGITFGLYWSVGNAFVHEIAPRGLNSAVMGVFGGCNSGGGFLGALGGGMLYRRGGGGFLFAVVGTTNACLFAATVVANFAAAARARRKRMDVEGGWRAMEAS